jgi:hypothetical protein
VAEAALVHDEQRSTRSARRDGPFAGRVS